MKPMTLCDPGMSDDYQFQQVWHVKRFSTCGRPAASKWINIAQFNTDSINFLISYFRLQN